MESVGTKSILIVDDEEGILAILGTVLKSEGYEVVAALGGEKAIPLIESKEDKFDLMISDVRMEPINGLQLLKIAVEKRPDMQVIMLTAYGQVETAIEALQLGAFDYVKKPFRVDDLLATVQKALSCGDLSQQP